MLDCYFLLYFGDFTVLIKSFINFYSRYNFGSTITAFNFKEIESF